VPTSWTYGTFHQNNPVYINLVKQQASTPQAGQHQVSSKNPI
jgi:hypothetical protein